MRGMKPELDAAGLRVVAIAKEAIPKEAAVFQKHYWPPEEGFELYLDEPRALFHKAGRGTRILSGIWSYITGGQVAQNWKRVTDAKVRGNATGEGTILGALLVVGAGPLQSEGDHGEAEVDVTITEGQAVPQLLLHHQERAYGDDPDPNDVLAAIRAAGNLAGRARL